jgi:hypothetical protein
LGSRIVRPAAQMRVQATAERLAARLERRQVDGLVRDVHRRFKRVLQLEAVRDLLRRPVQLKAALDLRS